MARDLRRLHGHHLDKRPGIDPVALVGELAARDLNLGQETDASARKPVGAERERNAEFAHGCRLCRPPVQAQVRLGRPDEFRADVAHRGQLCLGQRRPVDDHRLGNEKSKRVESIELLACETASTPSARCA